MKAENIKITSNRGGETVMKKKTKNILRVIISIIYIVWGFYAPLSALKAVIALDVGAIASAAVGVLMLFAGIFGLFGLKKTKCRVFGIIIFVCSLASVILALPSISASAIITAVLAWLFIICG